MTRRPSKPFTAGAPCSALLGTALIGTALFGTAAARSPALSDASLRLTVGGAVVVVTLSARDRDVLQRVWAPGTSAHMLRCEPRCRTATSIPIEAQTRLGAGTTYRVVLGGHFEPGQKIGLIFSFGGGNAAVEAVVDRDTAGLP